MFEFEGGAILTGLVACFYLIFMPRLACKVFGMLLLVVGATFIFLISWSRMDSFGALLGAYIIALYGASIVVGAGLGLLIRWLWCLCEPPETGDVAVSIGPRHVLETITWGVIATYLGGLTMVSPLQGHSYLLRALVLSALILVIAGTLPHLVHRGRSISFLLPQVGPFLATAAAAALVAFLAGALYTTRVIDSARAVAGNQPYCIEVATSSLASSSYHAATSLWDLHPFVMTRGNRVYHAQLVVKVPPISKSAYWSYNAGRFVMLWQTDITATCTPTVGFVDQLSWFP